LTRGADAVKLNGLLRQAAVACEWTGGDDGDQKLIDQNSWFHAMAEMTVGGWLADVCFIVSV
jgi:hypothetical protein